MNKVQSACGFLMIATVSACSSSNSNGGGGTVTLPVAAPFVVVEGAPAMTASALNEVLTLVDELDVDIVSGEVLAPTTAPTHMATFNGYIGLELPRDEFIAGNLEIVADFDSSSVTSSASNFKQFQFDDEGVASVFTADTADPDNLFLGLTGGALTGSGITDEGALGSTLTGDLTTLELGTLPVDITITGDLYDYDEGQLVIRGDVTGTVDSLTLQEDGSDFTVLEVLEE